MWPRGRTTARSAAAGSLSPLSSSSAAAVLSFFLWFPSALPTMLCSSPSLCNVHHISEVPQSHCVTATTNYPNEFLRFPENLHVPAACCRRTAEEHQALENRTRLGSADAGRASLVLNKCVRRLSRFLCTLWRETLWGLFLPQRLLSETLNHV